MPRDAFDGGRTEKEQGTESSVEVVHLVTQYRMPAEVCSVVSEAYYDGTLVTAASQVKKATSFPNIPGFQFPLMLLRCEESIPTAVGSSYKSLGEIVN